MNVVILEDERDYIRYERDYTTSHYNVCLPGTCA